MSALEGRWRLYECSDCNPEHNEGRELDDQPPYEEPFRIVLEATSDTDTPHSGAPLDLCPRCDAYGSLNNLGAVSVITDRERDQEWWRQRREAKS